VLLFANKPQPHAPFVLLQLSKSPHHLSALRDLHSPRQPPLSRS
jgi:hypothetical protein